MKLTDYNGPGQRLLVVCDYYLDLAASLRDSRDTSAIWPCPQCGSPSFTANFEAAAAGCTESDCQLHASMNPLDLLAYLDPEIETTDKHSASQKFSQIFEERITKEQHLQHQQSEQRQRTKEESRWQKGLRRQRSKQQGETEDTLF